MDKRTVFLTILPNFLDSGPERGQSPVCLFVCFPGYSSRNVRSMKLETSIRDGRGESGEGGGEKSKDGGKRSGEKGESGGSAGGRRL